MTEKEKNITLQQLWALIAQDAQATKHLLEISSRQISCIIREDVEEMTPNKRKVVEELKLQWRFVKTIHEDLEKIAAKLEKPEIVPEFPGIVISNELWAQNRISDVSEKIGDFQTALQNAIWELQELCQ
ncbi:MAG: hypothetical protein E7044_13000 [Lentisphaerae bacterium]|nr:hypothetical protein [Lentisphaerota bacterium]